MYLFFILFLLALLCPFLVEKKISSISQNAFPPSTTHLFQFAFYLAGCYISLLIMCTTFELLFFPRINFSLGQNNLNKQGIYVAERKDSHYLGEFLVLVCVVLISTKMVTFGFKDYTVINKENIRLFTGFKTASSNFSYHE